MTELSDDELNKRVHEIMGYCWHNKISQTSRVCSDCHRLPLRMDFIASWQGFGLMFEFMQKHERWEEFVFENGYADYQGTTREEDWIACFPITLISPRPFAEAMVRFFEEIKP